MFNLYKVTLRNENSWLRPILASASNATAAVWRAKRFAASHGYRGQLVRDEVEQICSTPDDVLDRS